VLSAREREELRVQWEQEGQTTMEATQLTWADELMLRNELQTMRRDIRHIIQRKFGEAPPDVDTAIDNAGTKEELTDLRDRAIFAQAAEDLLGTSPSNGSDISNELRAEDLSWAASLDEDEREEMARELAATLVAAMLTNDWAPYYEARDAWRATADVLSDPALTARLMAEGNPSEEVPLERL